MPDIFEIFNNSKNGNGSAPPVEEREQDLSFSPAERGQQMQEQQGQGQEQENLALPDNVQANAQDQEAVNNEIYSNQKLGTIAGQNTRDLEEDPDSWSPEYSARGWMEEAGVNIMQGVGNYIIKGTGDLVQMAGAIVDPTISDGTVLSRMLQDVGTDVAENFKSAIPEELKNENLSWGSVTNPKFWSQNIASMIPQIVQSVYIGGRGAAIAKSLLKKGVTKLPGQVGKTALGAEIFGAAGKGSGLAGKLGTDIGLTTLGNATASAIGGGIASNVYAGMLNAAGVVNNNKDLTYTNEQGEKVKMFSEEDLGDMAAGTMRNNSAWLAADMASWGLTYGGGYKALKSLNPMSKGGIPRTAAARAKMSSSLFTYDVAPIIKGLGRLSKKMAFEGIEESFQETFEEWASKKAVADKTGVPHPDLLDVSSFMDFYNSKENKGTKVLAGVMGAVSGGAFNLNTLVNQKADDALRLHNSIENLTNITNKQGTKDELAYQEYHIEHQVGNIAIDEKYGDQAYVDLRNSLLENGNINEEQIPDLDAMYFGFKEKSEKADRLNVKGKKALLTNIADENYFNKKLEEYKAIAEEKLEVINAIDAKSAQEIKDKKKSISETQQIYTARVKALSILKAEARQNQENLILGKKANPLEVEIVLDEFGNEMVIGGLSSQQMKEYTGEGDTRSKGKKFIDGALNAGKKAKATAMGITVEALDLAEKAEKKAKGIFEMPSLANATDKVKAMAKSIQDKFKTPEIDEEAAGEVAAEEEAQAKAQEEAEGPIEKVEEQKTSGTTIIDGVAYGTPKTQEQAQQEAEQMVDDTTVDENEVIGDDVWSNFEETGTLPDGILSDIADKIMSEGKLSTREEEIRANNPDAVLSEITRKILKIEKDASTDAVIDPPEGPIIKPGVNEDGTKKGDEDTDDKDEEKVEVDKDLSKEEQAFLEDEVTNKKKQPDLESVEEAKADKAKKNWKKNAKKVANSETVAFDSRESRAEGKVKLQNILETRFVRSVLNKIKGIKVTEATDLSQNELDNYLNRYTTYNLLSPSRRHSMAVVNHSLKTMFPNTNDPAQLIIVRNLFESVGSQGLGHALAATIFIDEKAPNQDKTFMHEMSHIYLKLSINTPETQALVKASLANKELVKDIRERYDDVTLYRLVLDEKGNYQELTKGQIANALGFNGAQIDELNDQIAKEVASGDLKTVPLTEQKYLIEEMLAKTLEGPLAANFDMVFTLKNEGRRKRDTKKWWGMLRKRGELIEAETGVDRMLKELAEDKTLPVGNMKDYLFNTFKAVTKGVKFDAYGLDQRARENDSQYVEALNEIQERIKRKATNGRSLKNIFQDEFYEETNDYDDDVEDGISFQNKDFDSHKKSATRILKRFGTIYNKAFRLKHLKATRTQKTNRKNSPILNQELLESVMYNLAIENKSAAAFIYNIENSEIKEIAAFNRFMKKVYPDSNEQLLSGIHFIFSNGKHINGIRTALKADGSYEMVNSLNQREITDTQDVLARVYKERSVKDASGKQVGSDKWNSFLQSVKNIKEGKDTEQDYLNVIDMYRPRNFKYSKVMEQGVLIHKGTMIPIETLISGYIKQNLLYQKVRGTNKRIVGQVNLYEGRLLAEALISTNRKFTNLSTVVNAEGNMEAVKITNNHLTKEVDNMIEFMSADNNGNKPTREVFIDRYSHVSKKQAKLLGKAYEPNLLLGHIYDQFQLGILPTISITHGIQDLQNNKGNTYKNSTSFEQRIDEMLQYVATSRSGNGRKASSYLQSMGAFSDSPRKFYMNMKRHDVKDLFDVLTTPEGIKSFKKEVYDGDGMLDYEFFERDGKFFKKNPVGTHPKAVVQSYTSEITEKEFNNAFNNVLSSSNPKGTISETLKTPSSRKLQFNSDGKLINSVLHMHNELFPDEKQTKAEFKKNLLKGINNNVKFMRENADIFSKKKQFSDYYKDGVLTSEGRNLAAEQYVNSVLNGYYSREIFIPGVKGKAGGIKRFKSNGSPIMSAKNENFKIEAIPIADSIANNSVSGTDGAMYITEKTAQKLVNLGLGVFDMNDGFKLLNASVEKDNPQFAGKLAYLKGYTTIARKGHPLYNILTAREAKYDKQHKDKYGVEPSMDLTDQSFNHIAIAVTQSSDKGSLYPDKFIDENKTTGELTHTDLGSKFTMEALSQDHEGVMEYYDKMFYDKKGNFVGLESYNFGPQQLMDVVKSLSTTPTQMINSVIVGATANGNMDLAIEIQDHISNQKQKAFNEILEKIASGKMEDYHALIESGLNKEDMDQAQRIIFEDGGSLSHPYITEIVTNQLAKTLRVAGNKLLTPGTIAHQKPDVRIKDKLEGYTKNTDGSINPAGIELPRHMSMVSKSGQKPLMARQKMTVYNQAGKGVLYHYNAGDPKKKRETQTHLQDLNAIKYAALKVARSVHGVSTNEEANKFIGEEFNENGVHIGYHVKGQTVIASRIPGHGPSSTGVFEVMAYNDGDGNQVMVSSEFNDIIGADNDGDALYIQHKGDNKKYSEWNQAFDKMTKYWTSSAMAEQIQAKMDIKASTEAVVKKVEQTFKNNQEYHLPGSPEQRAADYDNTLVAKNNVGPIFNLHKVANLYAAYEIELTRPVSINGAVYNRFRDAEVGQNSRNQKSAELANIQLDNASHHFADKLGIDSFNIAQATLLVNLGVSLEEVALILNSEPAKVYGKLKSKMKNIYNEESNYSNVFDQAYKALKIKKAKTPKLSIDTSIDKKTGKSKILNRSQFGNVLELFRMLEEMNSETQKVSKVMGGHKKIHVNPHVLEKELDRYDEVMAAPKTKKEIAKRTLKFTPEFRTNPDLKNYENVAREVLSHLKVLNPVYQGATNKVLNSLVDKIGADRLTTSQVEAISNSIKVFQTARLLGLNNFNMDEAVALLTPGNPKSIFVELQRYLDPLQKGITAVDRNNQETVSDYDNSILFNQALNLSLSGNSQYISANRSFSGPTMNPEERKAAQNEFAELPNNIKDALILYDLVNNNWSGPQSISIFFDEETNSLINYASNQMSQNKDQAISGNVLRKLETNIALKMAASRNNPLAKITLKKGLNVKNKNEALPDIMNSPTVKAVLKEGKGMFVNVKSSTGESVLYHIPKFTLDEKHLINSENNNTAKETRIREIANRTAYYVPNNLKKIKHLPVGAIDIALIADENNSNPYKTYETNSNEGSHLDPLVEATLSYEDLKAKLRENLPTNQIVGLDAIEEYDSALYTQKKALTQSEFEQSMEFKPIVTKLQREKAYSEYLVAKAEANKESLTVNPTIEGKSSEQLLAMYEHYGEKDVYAYSIIMTPIIKKLAGILSAEQTKLTGKKFEGQDVNIMKAYLMTGSNIPSNHPGAQGMARLLETQYKHFISEKKKHISKMNEVTDALYKEKLGYGNRRGLKTFGRRLKSLFNIGIGRENPYEKLYGNMVTRVKRVNDKGTLVYDYQLRPEKDINEDYARGYISEAEKNFYDYFRKTTNDLKPKRIKETKADYIPHTAMSTLETFASRGLLGLATSSKHEDTAILDVKLTGIDQNGDSHLMSFKQIEDQYKMDAANVYGKNNIKDIKEYRAIKRKAQKLLKTGKNEDGSRIIPSIVSTETVLGFGSINRFAHNRSIKATELPSMDLNKALGDYIHSSLFVEGGGEFQGMRKLQGYIDGVLAFNRENNLPQLNNHVQKVWKDYFSRGKRQTSFMGKKADKVVVALTRMNLFYSLGYQANKNTMGMYAIGNVLAGKYHNIKDVGGKAWIKGEARFWGLDNGMKGGITGVIKRHKRMARIMKNINFMEINVYDEVNMEKKNGLDALIGDMALSPMILSEKWIQQVHMLGLLSDQELDKFDDEGNYKQENNIVRPELLVELEDQVKSSHGRGYQPTDQRAVQMYSWGTMLLQFSRFIPTMFHDRFAKEDVNIYGKKNIGTLTSVGKMVRAVVNNPAEFVAYRKNLYKQSPEMGRKLDSGLKGMAMATILSVLAAESDVADSLFWDTNYYWNHPKLASKMVPPAMQTGENLMSGLF